MRAAASRPGSVAARPGGASPWGGRDRVRAGRWGSAWLGLGWTGNAPRGSDEAALSRLGWPNQAASTGMGRSRTCLIRTALHNTDQRRSAPAAVLLAERPSEM